MGTLGELFLDLVVGTGRIGDVEPALLIKGASNWPIDNWRSGDDLDFKSVRQSKGLAIEFHFRGTNGSSRQQTTNVNKARYREAHAFRAVLQISTPAIFPKVDTPVVCLVVANGPHFKLSARGNRVAALPSPCRINRAFGNRGLRAGNWR